ncbi:MAG: HAMP domain-containing protein [Candidatus Melainabacteria bacterium]|nr:MAG: HAMP domain-containing protein [Candidatus Melainabacteria bacterium]
MNWYLLSETEKESRREESYKEISANSSRLLQMIFDTGDAAGKFSVNHQGSDLNRYEASRAEIPRILSWLKDRLQNSPREIKLLNRIDKDVQLGLQVLEEIKKAGEAGDEEAAQQIAYFAMRRLQPRIDSLCRNQIAFQKIQREKIAKMPAELKKRRDDTRRLLAAGLGVNILGAILLGVFFIRSITSRLKVITENSERLRRKEELRPSMKGGDEIAQLDTTFHQMADSLRGEEELLRASEQQVKSMIEQMPVGLLVTKDADIEFANPMAEQLFKYSRGEIIGKSLGDLFAANSETVSNSGSSSSSSSNSGSSSSSGSASSLASWLEEKALDHVVEMKAFKSSGEEFPIEFSMSDVSLGRASRRLAMVLDVTERFEVQKMRREFVAMVSHELRTPLNSVSGFLQLLPVGVFGTLSQEAIAQAGYAEENINNLIGLITDLLDLEKMEAGKMDLASTASLLEDIIDQAINDITDAANEREISPYFEGCEVEIKGDVERLQQCITKILSFMISFTPTGAAINISAGKESNGSIKITISSRLLTIPEDLLTTIFERFQQLDLPGGRGSTGLGLPLAKTIVEQHKGSIQVTSNDNHGTTFSIHLPE